MKIFCRYLQEIGYTDAILDVRSSRVRPLLGLTTNDPTNKTKSGELAKANHVNDSEATTSTKPGALRISAASDLNISIKRLVLSLPTNYFQVKVFVRQPSIQLFCEQSLLSLDGHISMDGHGLGEYFLQITTY